MTLCFSCCEGDSLEINETSRLLQRQKKPNGGGKWKTNSLQTAYMKKYSASLV